MERHFCTVLAILSLLPIPVLAGVWVSSYPLPTHLWPNSTPIVQGHTSAPIAQGYTSLTCFRGTLHWQRYNGPVRVGESFFPSQTQSWWGFSRTLTVNMSNRSLVVVDVGIPCWAVMGLAAVPAGWGASVLRGQWLRGSRRRKGLCVECGYDLRASTDCCPECGTAIPVGAK